MTLLDQYERPLKTTEAKSAEMFWEVLERLSGASGSVSHAGASVTTATALGTATVFACVDAIAKGCAVPPLAVYRDDANGRPVPARDAPEFRILHRRPNEWQTSLEFRRTLTAHAALTGNGYAIPVRVNGRLRELIPVLPDQVHREETGRYRWQYRVYDEWGEVGVFAPSAIFHLPNLMWDTVSGLSALRTAREAIGLASAIEGGQARHQKNAGRPSGILYTDQALEGPQGKAAIDRLKAGWDKITNGESRGGTAVLDFGFKWLATEMSAVDSQLVETRRFQVEEICRAFGVFPQIVMHTAGTATFASAESFFAAHNRMTVGAWQEAWLQRLDEFALDGAGPLYARFENREIQTAPLKDRGEWAKAMAGAGGHPSIWTINELRELDGKPPVEGGDVLYPPSALANEPSLGDDVSV